MHITDAAVERLSADLGLSRTLTQHPSIRLSTSDVTLDGSAQLRRSFKGRISVLTRSGVSSVKRVFTRKETITVQKEIRIVGFEEQAVTILQRLERLQMEEEADRRAVEVAHRVQLIQPKILLRKHEPRTKEAGRVAASPPILASGVNPLSRAWWERDDDPDTSFESKDDGDDVGIEEEVEFDSVEITRRTRRSSYSSLLYDGDTSMRIVPDSPPLLYAAHGMIHRRPLIPQFTSRDTRPRPPPRPYGNAKASKSAPELPRKSSLKRTSTTRTDGSGSVARRVSWGYLMIRPSFDLNRLERSTVLTSASKDMVVPIPPQSSSSSSHSDEASSESRDGACPTEDDQGLDENMFANPTLRVMRRIWGKSVLRFRQCSERMIVRARLIREQMARRLSVRSTTSNASSVTMVAEESVVVEDVDDDVWSAPQAESLRGEFSSFQAGSYSSLDESSVEW